MTVHELIEILQGYDPEMQVCVLNQDNTCHYPPDVEESDVYTMPGTYQDHKQKILQITFDLS